MKRSINHSIFLTLFLFGISFILIQCKKKNPTPVVVDSHGTVDASLASFENMKKHIFDHNCVSCHNPSQAANTNGGLILTGTTVYENLINITAYQTQANTAGAILVKPFDADSSFLYTKCNFSQTGVYPFGNAMPLGADPLTANQILYIKQWIDAGAPKIGVVADAALLTH